MDQGPGQGDPLALPPRVRARRAVREGAEVEALARSLERALRIPSMQGRGKFDVLLAAQVRVAKGLVADPPERLADLLAARAEVTVVDPARSHLRHRPEDGQQRRLARPVRPTDDGDAPSLEGARHSRQCTHRTIRLANVVELDHGVFIFSKLRKGPGERESL